MTNSIATIGHQISAFAGSVLHTRNSKMARARVLATGAVFGGLFLVSTTNLAMAADLADYSGQVSQKTNVIPDIVSYGSYIGGAILSALGIVDLKKHVENPSSTPLKNGLAKLGFGGILLALPMVSGIMQDTMSENGQEANYQNFNRGGIQVQ